MVSKFAVAAGLLTSTFAQSTIYIDIYASTTTVTVDCSSICSTNALVQTQTVSTSVATATGAGAAAAAAADAAAATATTTATDDADADADADAEDDADTDADADTATATATATTTAAADAAAGTAAAQASSDSCSFQLAVNGTALQQISDGQVQLQLGQISDGQVQAGSGLTSSSFSLSGDMVYDQAGRVCYISGDDQAQFQCNTVPTTGSTSTAFSLIDSTLAFNSSTQFYACLLGGASDGYNIYATLTGAQSSCTPITLTAVNATNCVYTGTSLTQSASAAVVSTVTTGTTSLPAQTATSSAAIFTGAASSLSSRSAYGLFIAATVAYLFI